VSEIDRGDWDDEGWPAAARENCWACGGSREMVACGDDLCASSDECIHGDGMAPCDECDGTGEL
jgi:hypothetical protein